MPVAGKFVNVQVLRLVAALLVVGTHATLYTSQHLAPLPVWHFGEVGVDLFFVISGFVMMSSSWRHLHELGYGRVFFGRRLVRIAPMYWIATTLSLLLLIALPQISDERPSSARVVLSYLFVSTPSPGGRMEPLHGVGWTLVFEMFFYLVFAVALVLRANVLVFCAAVFTVLAGAGLLRPAHITNPLLVYLDPVLLYFVAGMALGAWVCTRATRPALLWGLLLLAAWTLDAALRSGGGGFAWYLLLRPVLVTAVVVVVVLLEPLTAAAVPVALVFLGDASYSLYLFHPFVGPVVPLVLAHLHLRVAWLSVVLVFAGALVAGAVVYRVVERPLTRALQRRVPGLRPTPRPGVGTGGATVLVPSAGITEDGHSRTVDDPG